jgi:SAM-dependent methyltransferase
VFDAPQQTSILAAYTESDDPVSLREADGQVETARRALTRIERSVSPGRLLDLGCWTGSFMEAARGRSWSPLGIEPSRWAAAEARRRGFEVVGDDLFAHQLPQHSFRLVVMGDVLEHLTEPLRALGTVRDLLEPEGALFLTVPNAGSLLARALGRRWWSVLPMHLQYFTPGSLELALRASGFEVEWARSHAKAFSMRYYAERLEGYSPLRVLRLADRMWAPDFHDRLQVLARPLPPDVG